MKLLDKYRVLLLDMNGTFMFGEDRFAAHEDFYRTYVDVGGGALSAAEVAHYIRTCYEGMSRDYADPAYYDDLSEGLKRYANAPDAEAVLLERVFALHELGQVPEWAASLLRRLGRTHKLALVANIWAPKHAWLVEFRRAGIFDAFQHVVFSSDSCSIKPSPVIYREALRAVGAQSHEALFVGDSLKYDIEGAKRVGMATAWVTSAPRQHESVDYVLSSLKEIETHAA
jgi:putative hydrolase of the HAD superfamily